MPMQEDAPGFRKSVTLKDKIHCVAFVIDASKVKLLPDRMIEKFAALRRKANQLGQCVKHVIPNDYYYQMCCIKCELYIHKRLYV